MEGQPAGRQREVAWPARGSAAEAVQCALNVGEQVGGVL
ncbi:MAG: hypothetical protein JWO17_2138, partial [Actinomycetia bacterium]|nr:hypothetical protein [Actinomycetes bacterium]